MTALLSSASAASIFDADSAVTAPCSVPPSAPIVPPAAATPRPNTMTAPHTTAPISLAAPQPLPTLPAIANPGVAPAARPIPAPFRAPIPFPPVGASTCVSGADSATGRPTVLSWARTSSVGDCGARGCLIAHPHGPAHTASTRTTSVLRRIAPVMAPSLRCHAAWPHLWRAGCHSRATRGKTADSCPCRRLRGEQPDENHIRRRRILGAGTDFAEPQLGDESVTAALSRFSVTLRCETGILGVVGAKVRRPEDLLLPVRRSFRYAPHREQLTYPFLRTRIVVVPARDRIRRAALVATMDQVGVRCSSLGGFEHSRTSHAGRGCARSP